MLTTGRLGKNPRSGRSGSTPSAPSVTLNSGDTMPLMAFGTLMETLQADFNNTVKIIEAALEVGYRHLDTAQVYNTEPMVGKAIKNKIKEGTLDRKDVFVTTKLWRNAYRQEDVVPSLRESLKRLDLDYVDLFLVHWPTALEPGNEMFPKENDKFKYASIDYLETWKGMEQCVSEGLTKAIGISNFNSKQIQRILDNCQIHPANHQIESHPYLTNTKMVDFCKERNISVMAYSPLFGFRSDYRAQQGWPTIYEDNKIKDIAKKHKATPAQVALAYQLQRGVGVAPKSSKRERMEENFAAQLQQLTEEDMATLEGCNNNLRLNAEFPDHPYYPFDEEF